MKKCRKNKKHKESEKHEDGGTEHDPLGLSCPFSTDTNDSTRPALQAFVLVFFLAQYLPFWSLLWSMVGQGRVGTLIWCKHTAVHWLAVGVVRHTIKEKRKTNATRLQTHYMRELMVSSKVTKASCEQWDAGFSVDRTSIFISNEEWAV